MTSLRQTFRFASQSKAKELLSAEDLFTQSWSQFDINSRVGKPGSTRTELFHHISEQVCTWSAEEVNKLTTLIEGIDDQIREQEFQLSYPKEIFLIRSTMLEEGGAMGYTRGNYIVLNETVCNKPEAAIQKLITHELFHVLTRNNPAFRKAMYRIIGFQIMPSITYPSILRDLRITNPDAPQTDSYITLSVNGKATPCMMILHADKPYEGGRFFDYLQSGFLHLTPDLQAATTTEGNPIIYSLDEVNNFYEQVGKNTSYIIHPEEILADNFAFAVLGKEALEDEWLMERIKQILKT